MVSIFDSILTFTLGCVIFSIERTTPPSGVALPVKLVCPAEIVRGIFALWQHRSTNAHSSSFLGRHKTSAFPVMLELSRSYPFTISKSEVISILNSNERNSTKSEIIGFFSAQAEIFSTGSSSKID